MELTTTPNKGIDDALLNRSDVFTKDLSVFCGWEEPKAIRPQNKDTPDLPPELIPEPLREWVLDTAQLMGVPAEYIAVPAFSALAIALGRQVGIQPNRLDTSWKVFASVLWCCVIGSPGKKKSPALSKCDKTIRAHRNSSEKGIRTKRKGHQP